MKTTFKILILASLAGAFISAITGCGSKGSNSNANGNQYCSPTDPYCTPYGPNGTYGYNTGYGYGPNTAIYRANVNITNGADWDQVMRASNVCSSISCSGVSYNPTLNIVLNDDTFSSPPTGISYGQISFLTSGFMGAGLAAPGSSTVFRPVNGNSGFQANISVGPTYNMWGSVNSTGGILQVTVNVPPSSGVGTNGNVVLYYNGQSIGSGSATRLQ